MHLGVGQCKGIHFAEEWVGLLQISRLLDDGFDSLVKLRLVVLKQSVIYKTCATDGLVYQDSLFLVRQKSVFERTSHIVTAFGFFGYTLNIGYFIEIIKKTKIRGDFSLNLLKYSIFINDRQEHHEIFSFVDELPKYEIIISDF